MSENFKLEIVRPDQTIFNAEVKHAVIPGYEGVMTILKDHISLITFLRPGFVEIETNNKTEKFYVEDGTVEFFNNRLLILSSSAVQVEKLEKENIEKMKEEAKVLLQNTEIKDKEKYILSYKIDSLQEIS
jgi:F-type H+-transporting ATPase subunit epsilon|tara:strand:- start:1672 stop:2061 length:390 start_codon:yes stop_codon:yes gene_type:complete